MRSSTAGMPFVGFASALRLILAIGVLLLQSTEAALLSASFPAEFAPSASGSLDVYCYVLSNQTRALQQQCYTAGNFTVPLFANLPPDTPFNVTLVVNDLPLLDTTRTFFTGPGPVTDLKAEVLNPTETVLSWKAPVHSRITGYRIQLLTRDIVSGNISRGDPLDWKTENLPISPLVPGTQYGVEIVAVNGNLFSEVSRIAFTQPALPQSQDRALLPIPTQPPPGPSGFQEDDYERTETSVVLMWSPPADGVSVDRYLLSVNVTNQPSTISLPPQTTRYEWKNLQPGTYNLFSLSAVKGNVSSNPVRVVAITAPLPPTGIRTATSSPHPNTLRVTWTPAGQFSGFQAWINSSNNAPTLNTTEPQVAFTGLLSNTKYNVSVWSFLTTGNEIVVSRPSSAVFQTGPDSSLSVIAVEGASELLLQTSDNTLKLLEANATSEDSVTVAGTVINAQHILFKDLVGGTRYSIVSKMLRNDMEELATFEKLTYPFAPVNLTAPSTLVTTESVMVNWSPPRNSRLQGYQVLYSRFDEGSAAGVNVSSVIPKPDVTSFNITGLVPASKYSVRMRSFIDNVFSVETIPVMQCTRPLQPVSVSVRASSVKLILQMTRPSNTTRNYRVRLVNLDVKDSPPRDMEVRNDSSLVSVSIPVDILGAVYEVRVATYFCDLLSDVVSVIANTLPPVVNFNRPPVEVTQTTIKLLYQITWPVSRSIFNRYAFQVEGYPPQYVTPGESKAQTIVFSDLVPGTRYVVYGWTERGEVQSDKRSIDVQMKPANLTTLTMTKITSQTISFEWEKPAGEITEYEVGYNNSEPIKTNLTSWTFTGLQPFTVYSVYVAAYSGLERSPALTRFYTTNEDKPGKVRMFTLSALRPYKLLGVRWAPPESPNGIITQYLLDYKENSPDSSWTQLSFPAKNTSHVLTLVPGKAYMLRISAINRAGTGPAQDGSIVMPIGAPVLARSSARPVPVASGSSSITVEFSRNFFTDVNGEVVNYAIIVAEDPTQLQGNANGTLLSWRDVHEMRVWPPYQVTDFFNPFDARNRSIRSVSTRGEDIAQITIGDDENCANSVEKFCNGPLKEGTQYFVKLRAFSSMDKEPLFTDTAFTEPIFTAVSNERSTLAIAIGVIVPVILLIICAFIFVLMRRKNIGPFVKRARKAVAKTADDKISIAESLPEKSRPVKLKEFADHVRVMSADSDFKFSEEYEDLKHVGRDQPCIAADLPVNRAKNRFTNILPYDHSRVKLNPMDDEEGSDYVNANYIAGENSPREFIVMQGPLPSTRDDFWRMIWEQNCRAVVMLTRCVEKGREKCDHYWPYDTDPIIYGDVEVVVMNEIQTIDWVIREFRVQRNDEPPRSVRHFHFTAWPDFGVPERPQVLIKFVRLFRERVPFDNKPIVVHCSAGVGRSGTFVALDRLLQQTKKQDHVDIFGMVADMRKDRVWMVQTEQQYICIHQCLLCVLEGREDDPGAMSMHENAGYQIDDEDEGIAESGPF